MAPALSTRSLNKSFGSLTVAQDIALELPQGVRYALIGPNGAGKTTLMNLLTGMLSPDSGAIFLGGEEITRLRPDMRVKKGLSRTFQINTLFAQLSALESVTLAVLEREGHAHNWWRGLPRFGAAIDEAQGILDSLKVPSGKETRELPYGQQRLLEIALALAARPKVLLLDEPAAGVPSHESGIILSNLAKLPPEIAILIIEHDMDLVFRFAQRITVLVQGTVLVEAPPEEIARDKRVHQVYLGEQHA